MREQRQRLGSLGGSRKGRASGGRCRVGLPQQQRSAWTRTPPTDEFRLHAYSKRSRTPLSRGGAMKYMLFTYRDPSIQLDPEQRAAVPAAVAAWCEEMDARGVRLQGHVLGPLTEARTIRIRAGELMVG